MKVVKFLGGLGNQMFQYAFYLSLEKHFKNVKADLSDFESYALHNGFELEKIFNIHLKPASTFDLRLLLPENRKWIWRKLRRLYNAKDAYWEEFPQFVFHKQVLEETKSKYYWGYWQHINYFQAIEKDIRAAFRFPEMSDEKNISLAKRIKENSSVALHVRRGDYIQHPILGGLCDEEYYKKSIDYINEQVESPLFIIFSNDIAWCKEQFGNLNAVFVDWNTGRDSYIDMQLMSMCKHFIIANSSFSWWGAWLQASPDKIVISPKKWVNDDSADTSGLILPSFITF